MESTNSEPWVVAYGDAVTEIWPDCPVVFGRAPAAGSDESPIPFPDERRLSRTAGRLVKFDGGIALTNLSTSHALEVATPVGRLRLPPTEYGSAPTIGVLMVAGSSEVTGPAWPDSNFGLTVRAPEPIGGPAPLLDAADATYLPLRLDVRTKQFMTALILTRPRLAEDGTPDVAPGVPAIVDQIAELTGSWHLARDGSITRTRQQVHQHLNVLRAKLVEAGLARSKASFPADLVAALLVRCGALRREHLKLLTDPGWLTWQENRWWHSDDSP